MTSINLQHYMSDNAGRKVRYDPRHIRRVHKTNRKNFAVHKKKKESYLSFRSRSRYSRSMRLSMRDLMTVGEGTNRLDSCRVTSATKSLCLKLFRAFMMRTTAASVRCLSEEGGGGVHEHETHALLRGSRFAYDRHNDHQDKIDINNSSRHAIATRTPAAAVLIPPTRQSRPPQQLPTPPKGHHH